MGYKQMEESEMVQCHNGRQRDADASSRERESRSRSTLKFKTAASSNFMVAYAPYSQ